MACLSERPATAERLLNREQINALVDIEWLEAELDKVTADAKSIEVDLEFRSDEFATDEWEHRARKALAAHHICQGHLTRRIALLRKGGVKGPTPAEVHDAKARKREAEAARLAAAAENKRARAAAEREKTVRQLVAYASRQSLLAHFHAAARDALERDTFAELMAQAHARLEATLMKDLPAQGIEAASAGETSERSGEGSTVGESPVGEADAPKEAGHD